MSRTGAPIPRVTLSYAQSMDGRIATASGQSRWISSPASLKLAHRLRASHEALLVGIGTVLRDNPRLDCRLPGRRSPLRVILDSRLRLPLDGAILRTAGELPTLVLCLEDAPPERRRALERAGLRVVCFPADAEGRVPLRPALEYLAGQGRLSLLVEGGAQVITSFLRQGLVHRLVVVTAALVIGEGITAVGQLGVQGLAQALRPRRWRTRRLGPDLVWELDFCDP